MVASGGDTYLWSTGSTTDTETYATSTTGTVTITNTCGQDVVPFTIVFGAVDASFTISDTSAYEPATIDFNNTSINATNGNWNFGDGQTSTTYNGVNTYANDGTYLVTLIASNTFGCSDTAFNTITVLPIPEIIIPNIFTPNSDNVNDVFFVNHPLITNIHGAIYNRWGNLLYESNAIDFIWNGNEESGEMTPEGTYFYIMEITMINGEVREKSGAVMLIQ